jgi:lipopolysaccharide/colanic/teichoic acid biosynthesis glycosyltransferase
MMSVLLKQIQRYKAPDTQSTGPCLTPELTSKPPSRYLPNKYLLDYFLAVILLVPGLPLMAICIILVRLTSRGPGIYTQCRVGRKGRIFCMYKIRSMKHNAEDRTGPAWTQTADPRVTLLGRFLRKFHLDELPQLFNVLQGEMSLVGPRPERPEFVEILSRRIPDYTKRLDVKPGITGLAQLNLPPDSDLDSVRRKVILDVEYIESANGWLDLQLIFCTALRFSKLPVLGLLGLQRSVKLSAEDAEQSASPVVGTVVTLQQFQVRIDSNGSNGSGKSFAKRADRHKCKKSQAI